MNTKGRLACLLRLEWKRGGQEICAWKMEKENKGFSNPVTMNHVNATEEEKRNAHAQTPPHAKNRLEMKSLKIINWLWLR